MTSSAKEDKSRIGFIGVGGMGGNMARRLVETGFDLTAFDIDQKRAKKTVGDVASIATDVPGVVSHLDFVCTSLPDPTTVREVYLGNGGIIEAAESGTALMDFSTVDPFTSREVARVSGERGLHFFDCPVSGGPNEAATGQLVLFLGGAERHRRLVQPILECLSKQIHYIGASGAGATVKMVNNVIANGTVLLTAEAFVLGVRLGLDPDRLFEVLMTAGARSHHFAKRFPRALANDFEPGYKLSLARKDMALALDAGRALKMPLSVTACMHELYTAGGAQGMDAEDYVAIIKYFEDLAGVRARGSNTSDQE